MKTYILASIFTDKESLKIFENNDGNLGINWVTGAPTIRYREYGTDKEFFPAQILGGKTFLRLFGSSYMRVVVGIMAIP